jgi:hypothetical protein
LNQHCALAPGIESILRAQMSKIVLQQNLPGGDIVEPLFRARLQTLKRRAGCAVERA